MDHYIGQQIIDELRNLNSNIRELVEVLELTPKQSDTPEQQAQKKAVNAYEAAKKLMQQSSESLREKGIHLVNPNALNQPPAEWETDLGTRRPEEASWEEFSAEKKDN